MRPIRLTADQRLILDNLPDPVVIYDIAERVRYVNAAFITRFGWQHEEVIGTKNNFVPSGKHSGLTGAVAILLSEDHYMTPDTQRMTKTGDIIDVQLNISLLLDDQHKVIGNIVIMRDITLRKVAERAERDQRTFAQALNAVTLALNSSLELSEVLERIVINVGQVVPHDLALVDMLQGGRVHVVSCKDWTERGLDEKLDGLNANPQNVPYLMEMARTHHAVIISDFEQYHYQSDLAKITQMRSYLGAPIYSDETLIGFIGLQRAQPDAFSDVHAERLAAFANQAAIAILNAQQYEQVQELATINERQRIARELHDAVNQTLFSASIISETLMLKAPPDGDIHDGLNRLQELNRGALAEMRTLLVELRPEALVNSDLSELLSHLVNALNGRKNLTVNLEAVFQGQLPPDVQVCFYRIAQEAFNNITKHAQAENVNVFLTRNGALVQMTIADDGVGFGGADIKTGHFGLSNMRERAMSIGATLTLDPVPGEGTTIILRWTDEEGWLDDDD